MNAGRLDDATKLLQTQRRDSEWRLQDLVNEAFPPFSEEITRSKVWGTTSGKFLKSVASVVNTSSHICWGLCLTQYNTVIIITTN